MTTGTPSLGLRSPIVERKNCVPDVSLLRQGFEKFRQEVKNLTFREDPEDSDNPFPDVGVGVKNCTTAELAYLIFRYVHLKPYTVGITREQGYPEEAQSEMAREYLAYRNRVDFDGRLRTSSSTEGEKKITIEREVSNYL